MQQPSSPEIFYNPLSLWTLSTRKISDSLAAHCGRGASFGELRDSVNGLPLPELIREALKREDENIVCAESTDRLGRFIGIKGITRIDITDNEKKTVCVHGRKNQQFIRLRGGNELVFPEAAKAKEFWREFKWILCNAGHIVEDLGFFLRGWPHSSCDWFPSTFFADLLKHALEKTPTNFIRPMYVYIPPNAGVTDPTFQMIADQAEHIRLKEEEVATETEKTVTS